jgi:hypothetical protein
MKSNIKGCGKIEGGFEDGICRPCYSFITADQGKEHMKDNDNLLINDNPQTRSKGSLENK